MTTLTLHGGPLDGQTRTAPEPWPQYQTDWDDGSGGVASYLTRDDEVNADYIDPNTAVEDPFDTETQGPPGDPGAPGIPGTGTPGSPGGGIIWTGDWNSAVAYDLYEGVSYDEGAGADSWVWPGPGSSTVGLPPSEANGWQLIAEHGAAGGPPGSPGPSPTPQGDYSGSTGYVAGDLVSYSTGTSNDGGYIIPFDYVGTITGTAPPASPWRRYVPAGPQGPRGIQGIGGPAGPAGPPGLVAKGAWVNGAGYSENDWVTYDNSSYYALNDIISSTSPPNVDTTNWGILALKGGGGGASQLDDLTDVDVTGVQPGDTLIRNPANDGWIIGQVSALLIYEEDVP